MVLFRVDSVPSDADADADTDTAKPIGSATLSEASTASANSADFDSDTEQQKMDLKAMVKEFKRLESEIVDISNYIYFLGSKVSTMRQVFEVLINDQ